MSVLLLTQEDYHLHSKGDQSCVFFGRNDAKAETPVLWPPHVKSWLFGKDSDAGRDWGQEEKGMTEDEMAGWHHWLDGHEFGWTPGIGDGQGGLSCFNSWGRKESDTPEQLNWIETWKFELNFTWRDIMYWLSGESPCVNILFPSLENLYYRRPLEIKLVILIQNSEI